MIENFELKNNLLNADEEELLCEDTQCQSAENQITDGCFFIKCRDKVFCCMTIIGQIEGHFILSAQHKTTKYEHIIPRIITIDQDENVDGLLMILNTVGGDIEAGMAISELICGLRKPSVSLVLGGGHSIGIPLAVSADRSFITQSATMTIHPVRMNGLVMGVPQQLAYFQNMQERIVSFVSEHSKISSDRFRELMLSSGKLVSDFGTVLEGEQAVKEGIIDSIGSISDAIEELSNLTRNS
ncbi:MAG: ATP-dependent Clp protease proteolytic subunit [Clostridia bacterium]|nr:ATP-dependent Clp protease proteolytic subunit [Clostridia bacterium]